MKQVLLSFIGGALISVPIVLDNSNNFYITAIKVTCIIVGIHLTLWAYQK